MSTLAQNTPPTFVSRPQGSAISLALTPCDRCKDRNLQCDQIHPTCGACAISDPRECSYPPVQQTPAGSPVADPQKAKPSVNGRPPAAVFHKENWSLVKKPKHSFTFVPGNVVKGMPRGQSKKGESSIAKQKKARRDELKRTAEMEVEQPDKSPRISSTSTPITCNPFTDQHWAFGENSTPITPSPSVSDSEIMSPASSHDRQMSPASNRANSASPKPARKTSTCLSKDKEAATDDRPWRVYGPVEYQAMVTNDASWQVSTWNDFQPLVPEGEDTVPVIHKTKFRGRPPRSRWQSPNNEGEVKREKVVETSEITESFDNISLPLSPIAFSTNLSSITLCDHALSRGDSNLWTLSYTHGGFPVHLKISNVSNVSDFCSLLSSLVTKLGTYNPNINPNTIPSWAHFGPQSANENAETSNSNSGASSSSHNNNNAMQLINKNFLGKYGSRTYKEESYESGIFEIKWDITQEMSLTFDYTLQQQQINKNFLGKHGSRTYKEESYESDIFEIKWIWDIAQEMSLTSDHILQQLARTIIGQFLSCGNVFHPTIHGKRFSRWVEELASPSEDALVMAIMAAWCRHTLLIHPTSGQNFTIDQVEPLEVNFRKRALKLFEDTFDQPSYGTLCTLIYILIGFPDRHKTFHQLAGRIIHTLDLFSRVSPRSADALPLDSEQQSQEEMERRMWWDWYYNNDCCKVLPTLSLAEFNTLIPPSPLPDESKEDTAGVIFHFRAKARLRVIQRAVSDGIDDEAMSRDQLAQFEKMLADWLESRPAFFKLDNPAKMYTNVWTFYFAVEVNIKYHYSRLIFHRLFVNKENANSDSVAICVRSCEDIARLLHARHAANYCRPNVRAWIDVCDTLLDLMSLGVLNKEHERSVRHSLAKALHLLEKTKAYEKGISIFIDYGEKLEKEMARYGISALASLEGEDYFKPDLKEYKI